jgi:hypothetical protein
MTCAPISISARNGCIALNFSDQEQVFLPELQYCAHIRKINANPMAY